MVDDDLLLLGILFSVVVFYNAQRNRHKLTRSAVVNPKYSPWQKLLMNGDDQSFLNITGFSRDAFSMLEADVFTRRVISRHAGRPSLLDRKGQLGLYLLFVSSKMVNKHLCLLFGIIPSTASILINRLMHLVVSKLKRNRRSRIKFPTDDEMHHFAALVSAREPKVRNIIGFVDGVSIPVQCSDEEEAQNAAYNGYHHDTMCNNVFAFAPTGKVIFACINFPGSWHDSSVCESLIEIVLEKIGVYAFCVDQGFTRNGELYGKFVGPLSKRVRKQLAPALRELLMAKHALYISLRQSSEWGMRSLQGSFSRLKSRLTSNSAKRQKLILSIVLLHNYRTDCVGLNQIATVFNPEYQQYIHLETYDRIARYFQ
jgi:hypothetical protein